jgi:hypothetical protein
MSRTEIHTLREGDVFWDGKGLSTRKLPHGGCYIPLDERCEKCIVRQGCERKIFAKIDNMLYFWVGYIFAETNAKAMFEITHNNCKREKG